MIDHQAAEPFELYRRFKAGDERAFAELYDRLSPGLYNYLCRLLGDVHRAEDALVETFTKLARSNLDGPGNVKAWLYRVATNHCYKWFRKNREVCMPDGLPETAGREPLRDFLRENAVQRMLNSLPEAQRVVVALKFFEDLSYAEIAEILCIPLGTVKSRMHDGIKKLRQMRKK